MTSPARQDWIDEARRADVWQVLCRMRPGHRVKMARANCVGPCPVCGGTDRFSVNRVKNVFLCRVGGRSGDAIALAQYLDDCDFLTAVETITGRPPPEGDRGRGVDAAALAQRAAAQAEDEARRASEANVFRDREIARAHRIWSEARPLDGSVAEAYLDRRGLKVDGAVARLRAAPALPYWHDMGDGQPDWQVIHTGPALVAAITGPDRRFSAAHITWIDLARRNGKANLFHPRTGEALPAKKIRGSAAAGHILLGVTGDDPARLVLGEGIETVLSVAMVEQARAVPPTVYWAGVSLGNIGGRAAAMVRHPTLTITDSRGRVRAQRVPGPVPHEDRDRCLAPFDGARDILLLGDGDSDRFTTEQHLKRFAARWQQPNRSIRAAWAEAGADFNDMWRAA